MALPRPVEPELITVGTDEVVVTAETADDAELTTRVGDHEITTSGPHHVARVTGLDPDTEYELEVTRGAGVERPRRSMPDEAPLAAPTRGAGVERPRRSMPDEAPLAAPTRGDGVEPHAYLPAAVRTLARPAGALLATIATANDVHFGETVCGATGDPAQDAKGPLVSAGPGEAPYPQVMNAAVVEEMRALGPDVVVVKGDLTAAGTEGEYADFLGAYGSLGAVMHHVRGNHDAMLDPKMAIEDAPYAVVADGVTLAVLDTVIPGTDAGQLSSDQLAWLDALAGEIPGAVLAFGHHPCFDVEHGLRTGRPYFGIQPDDSDALVDVVARHDNIVGYFAGHTHRNRVRRFDRARNIPFAEVGCTKDYPGAWAEYRVYEGGYTQTVRRVAAPDAFAWAEKTRVLYEGVYRDYALGPLEHRCFTQLF